MAKLLKLRRGTTSQHSSFTGAEGEVTVDTTKDTLVVHDGSTAGGHPVAAQDMDNVPAGAILGTQLENSGVTAGQYGSSSAIPIVTVDAQGLVTAASTTAIDSTTIANGSSSVSVANNGAITSNANHDFSAGIDVTGNSTFTGTASFGNNISVTGTSPFIDLVDSDNNSDYKIENDDGSLKVKDMSNSNATRLQLHSDGTFDVYGNLDANNGLDVTGNANIGSDLTVSGGDITINGTLPALHFNDTDHESDYQIRNNNGTFQLLDVDQGGGTVFFQRETNADCTITGNLNVTSGVDVTGNITCTGTVDGRDVNADGGKLDGIESGATADQSASEILTLIKTVDGSGSGLDADSLDGLGSTAFLRSNAGDTADGDITFNGGAGAISLTGGSDIRMTAGTWTGEHAGKWQYHGDVHYIQSTSGWQFRDATGAATMHLAASGAITGKSLTFTPDIVVNGGAGALTVAASSDIRFNNGNWTGEACKIQQNGNILYIQGGSNSDYNISLRSNAGSDRIYMNGSGDFYPQSNGNQDLGKSSNRWQNIYTSDLNLSNEAKGVNDIDGTWGDYTIVEGESDLFLKNNRSGKKYKFNLTEVS